MRSVTNFMLFVKHDLNVTKQKTNVTFGEYRKKKM